MGIGIEAVVFRLCASGLGVAWVAFFKPCYWSSVREHLEVGDAEGPMLREPKISCSGAKLSLHTKGFHANDIGHGLPEDSVPRLCWPLLYERGRMDLARGRGCQKTV